MEYDNETLAQYICDIDKKAQKWVYNRHCSYCGKFIYDDELKCKKCQTTTSNSLKRPIPFATSATAIEKLICWLKTNQHNEILDRIAVSYTNWLKNNVTADAYKMEIIVMCINYLEGYKNEATS